MKISIEDTNLIQRTSKKTNKPYFQQQAYAHLVNTDGSPKRYPQEILIFPQRDNAGNAVAYQKGDYNLLDSSFSINNFGSLELNFVNLQKIK